MSERLGCLPAIVTWIALIAGLPATSLSADSAPSSITVLGPSSDANFPAFYKRLKREELPGLVTADSALWAMGRLHDQALAGVEVCVLLPRLEASIAALCGEADRLADEASPESLAGPARRLGLYLWTARGLLDETSKTPKNLAKDVKAELKRIAAHEGFEFSSVLDQKMDYSQMAVRGHYTRSPELRRYFLAQMWLGRTLFRFEETHPELSGTPIDHPPLAGWFEGVDADKASEGDATELTKLKARFPQQGLDELRTAALLWICANRTKVGQQWAPNVLNEADETLRFFFGPSDDPGLNQIISAWKQVSEAKLVPASLTDDNTILRLAAWLVTGRAPAIDSTGMGRRGVSLLGQRSIYDSQVFQTLVADDDWPAKFVGEGDPFTLVRDDLRGPLLRGFPRGLDLAAAAGNDLALGLLTSLGDTAYEGYDDRMAEARNAWQHRYSMGGRGQRALYEDILQAAMLAASDKPSARWPAWMKSPDHARLRLNTGLAFWTSLRHDAVLHAKQSYSGALRSMPRPPGKQPAGMVEPQRRLYERLGAIAGRLHEFLSSQDGLPDAYARNAEAVEQLMEQLSDISKAQLSGPHDDEALAFIADFGGRLDSAIYLSRPVADRIGFNPYETVSLVADVHTRAPLCLEEAIGPLWEVRVGEATGAVFSYHEFKHPLSERLTDEAWREMILKESPAPVLLAPAPKKGESE